MKKLRSRKVRRICNYLRKKAGRVGVDGEKNILWKDTRGNFRVVAPGREDGDKEKGGWG